MVWTTLWVLNWVTKKWAWSVGELSPGSDPLPVVGGLWGGVAEELVGAVACHAADGDVTVVVDFPEQVAGGWEFIDAGLLVEAGVDAAFNPMRPDNRRAAGRRTG